MSSSNNTKENHTTSNHHARNTSAPSVAPPVPVPAQAPVPALEPGRHFEKDEDVKAYVDAQCPEDEKETRRRLFAAAKELEERKLANDERSNRFRDSSKKMFPLSQYSDVVHRSTKRVAKTVAAGARAVSRLVTGKPRVTKKFRDAKHRRVKMGSFAAKHPVGACYAINPSDTTAESHDKLKQYKLAIQQEKQIAQELAVTNLQSVNRFRNSMGSRSQHQMTQVVQEQQRLLDKASQARADERKERGRVFEEDKTSRGWFRSERTKRMESLSQMD